MQRRQRCSNIRERTTYLVRPKPGCRQQGSMQVGGRSISCALGAAGPVARKREGDQGTPLGLWRMIGVLYRPDRVARPRTTLPVRAITRNDGWCDDSGDRNYNRLVTLPYPASAETLWRADHLYDVVVTLSHNWCPRVRGLGSAVFMHVAHADYAPTEGCVALAQHDLLRLLSWSNPDTSIRIVA